EDAVARRVVREVQDVGDQAADEETHEELGEDRGRRALLARGATDARRRVRAGRVDEGRDRRRVGGLHLTAYGPAPRDEGAQALPGRHHIVARAGRGGEG